MLLTAISGYAAVSTDPQGGLVLLFLPAIQLFYILILAVIILVTQKVADWRQWRKNRRAISGEQNP